MRLRHQTVLGMDLGKRGSKRTRKISPKPNSTSIRRRPTPCQSSSISPNRTIQRRASRGSAPAGKPPLGVSRAASSAFNDTHRNVIYRVEQAYYQLLNASGQEEAARANLSNAQAVQQAAEERLNHGLATLPDLLEARSATAQAEYELQAVLGAEEIAYGNLATALGTTPQPAIRVPPLRELTVPSA